MKRVVKFTDLDPDQRRLVQALLAAQANACAEGKHVIVNGRCRYEASHHS